MTENKFKNTYLIPGNEYKNTFYESKNLILTFIKTSVWGYPIFGHNNDNYKKFNGCGNLKEELDDYCGQINIEKYKYYHGYNISLISEEVKKDEDIILI